MLKTKVVFFITVTFVLSSEPIHSINPWQNIAVQVDFAVKSLSSLQWRSWYIQLRDRPRLLNTPKMITNTVGATTTATAVDNCGRPEYRHNVTHVTHNEVLGCLLTCCCTALAYDVDVQLITLYYSLLFKVALYLTESDCTGEFPFGGCLYFL